MRCQWQHRMRYQTTLFLCVILFLDSGCKEMPTAGKAAAVSPAITLKNPVGWGTGPRFSEEFALEENPTEPVYITGFSVQYLDGNGVPLQSKGPSLDWWDVSWVDRERHGQLIGCPSNNSESLVREDGSHLDFYFPEGYALPIFSNEPLLFRGSWSAEPDQVSSGEVMARLEVHFVRAKLLKKKPQAVYCQSAWAGVDGSETLVDAREPWLLSDGEPATGAYRLAPGVIVIEERWVKGPGVERILYGQVEPNVPSGDGKLFEFQCADVDLPRPTMAGVNLYLLDSAWTGWK